MDYKKSYEEFFNRDDIKEEVELIQLLNKFKEAKGLKKDKKEYGEEQ